MDLTVRQTNVAQSASTVMGGHEEFDVTAGKTLKIETTPQGDDILLAAVPAGKKWRVVIGVEVTETDA